MAVKGPAHCGKAERVKHKLATTLLVVAALVVATLSAVTITARAGDGGARAR